MIRRDFLKASTLLGSASAFAGQLHGERASDQPSHFEKRPIANGFSRYREGNTSCPVYRVTPDDGYYIHTFYDICPWSPSQRYLACTKFPFQDREPTHADRAEICLIDLEDHTITEVYSTTGWGFQLGANIQWGATDRFLYFNDKVDEQVVAVRLDLENGKSEALAGPMYHIAPDESSIIGFPLDLINATQGGYGAAIDPQKQRRLDLGAAEHEGIWRTDLKTNKKTLLVSLAQAYEVLPKSDKEKFEAGTFYFFHSKFSPKGDRILQVFRCLVPESMKSGDGSAARVNPTLLTFNTDGSDLRVAIPNEVWGKGGNHPNWHPDNQHILMNLKLGHMDHRLCRFCPDGSDFTVMSDTIFGSGHPSFHGSGRYIITDSYPGEKFAAKSGEVPIRLIDVERQSDENICFIFTNGRPEINALRVDPHVVWSRDFTKVCFNGAAEGRRQIYIADLSEVVGS